MLLAAGLVAVLAIGSAAGGQLLAAGVLIAQLIFALGAVRLAPVASAQVAAWFAAVVGMAATAWVAWARTPELAPVARVLGPAVVIAIVAQLWRRGGRPQLTASLSLMVAGGTLAALPAAWVALRFADGGQYAVGLGLLGVGTGVLAEMLRISPALRRPLAVFLAGAAAAGLIILMEDMAAVVPAVGAVVIAVFGAVMAATALAVVDRLAEEPVRRSNGDPVVEGGSVVTAERRVVASLTPLRIGLPLVAAAPVVYVLGRVLVG